MVQHKPLLQERRSLLFLLAAVLLAGLLGWAHMHARPGKTAVVFWNGEPVWEFDLEAYDEPVTVSMEELGFAVPVRFELRDHQIRFVEVDCPDKLCEGFGFIGLPTQTAVCMPNRVSVSVMEE